MESDRTIAALRAGVCPAKRRARQADTDSPANGRVAKLAGHSELRGLMAATTTPERPASTPHPRLGGSILLATDGTAQSIGAFAAAQCIAAGGTRRGDVASRLPVHVVTVCDALAAFPPTIVSALPGAAVRERCAELHAAALEQLHATVLDHSRWTVEAVSGLVAPTIAELAAARGATLIVMGLGQHQVMDRLFGRETTLQVMQLSDVPVLSVPEAWTGIPRRVLIAVDFGAASRRAARTAMCIVPPGAQLSFAHVAPTPDAACAAAVGREFERFVDAVGVPRSATVEPIILAGDPARALLDRAREAASDMIVVGSHGLNAVTRLFVGSVASKLVRGASCPVLSATAGAAACSGERAL